MGIYQTLRDNTFALLEEIDDIQEKHNHPTLEFNGFPACFILPVGNRADYLTNVENKRPYLFNIWIFQEYDETSLATAYNVLMDCIDLVLNKFDEQDSPDSNREMQSNIPAGYTLVSVRPSSGEIMRDDVDKKLFVAITVECYITVDLTTLA